jgi:hypothetical protein
VALSGEMDRDIDDVVIRGHEAHRDLNQHPLEEYWIINGQPVINIEYGFGLTTNDGAGRLASSGESTCEMSRLDPA